jgi:hypothetical protein
MIDIFSDRIKAKRETKASEEEQIAQFVSSQGICTIPSADHNKMQKVDKKWAKETSPAAVERRALNSKYLIFGS